MEYCSICEKHREGYYLYINKIKHFKCVSNHITRVNDNVKKSSKYNVGIGFIGDGFYCNDSK